jgi:GNAT superfamily N-acetyltransferase
VTVETREEPFDGDAAAPLLAAFAEEIVSLYPGWHPGLGPTSAAEDFVPPSGRFVIAYQDGRPVGCGGVKSLHDGSVEVKRLFVAPEARRRGVARLILRRLENAAREAGNAVIRLDTGEQQPGALELFRSSGYREIGDYNGNPFASYWLEKPLTRPPADRASGR